MKPTPLDNLSRRVSSALHGGRSPVLVLLGDTGDWDFVVSLLRARLPSGAILEDRTSGTWTPMAEAVYEDMRSLPVFVARKAGWTTRRLNAWLEKRGSRSACFEEPDPKSYLRRNLPARILGPYALQTRQLPLSTAWARKTITPQRHTLGRTSETE